MVETLFHASAYSVLPFWFLMIFFPHVSFVKKIIASPWIILPPTICYLIILMPHLQESIILFYKPSPTAVAAAMSQVWGASLFWAYAGAFDLFVGRWIFLDAHKRRITFWLVSPIMFVCILFGPLGFAIYGLLRLIYSLTQKDTLTDSEDPSI